MEQSTPWRAFRTGPVFGPTSCEFRLLICELSVSVRERMAFRVPGSFGLHCGGPGGTRNRESLQTLLQHVIAQHGKPTAKDRKWAAAVIQSLEATRATWP